MEVLRGSCNRGELDFVVCNNVVSSEFSQWLDSLHLFGFDGDYCIAFGLDQTQEGKQTMSELFEIKDSLANGGVG